MGTYQFKPFAVWSRNSTPTNWGVTNPYVWPALDSQLVLAANVTSALGRRFTWGDGIFVNVAGTGNITFEGRFYLDGDPTPLELNDLPVGFTPTSCQLHCSSAAQWASLITMGYTIGLRFALETSQQPTEAALLTTFDAFPVPSAFQIYNHLIFDLAYDGNPAGQGTWGFNNFFVEGEYTAMAWTFTIDPPAESNVEANTPGHDTVEDSNGTLITITSDPENPDALLFDELEIVLSLDGVVYAPPIYYYRTQYYIQFWLPSDYGIGGDLIIQAVGNGTQFSGSINLAHLTVLLTAASGVYVLTQGATHDILYSSLRDGTTRNVKIPKPFIKTGFLGG